MIKKKTKKKLIATAILVAKLSFVGVVAGAVVYIGANARFTRDMMVYSQGVVRGVKDCKTLTTSMPSGDTELIVPWLTAEFL